MAKAKGSYAEWTKKAKGAYKKNDFKRAIGHYSSAIKFKPTGKAWNSKGDCYMQLHLWGMAATCYGKASELNPKNADYWYNRGLAMARQLNAEAAINYYDTAIRLDGKDADFWAGKGTALGFLGRNAEALMCFEKALSLDKKHEHAKTMYAHHSNVIHEIKLRLLVVSSTLLLVGFAFLQLDLQGIQSIVTGIFFMFSILLSGYLIGTLLNKL